MKYLILLPLLLGMLTYVSCSQDEVDQSVEEGISAEERKIELIRSIIQDGSEVTPEEKARIMRIIDDLDTEAIKNSEIEVEQGPEKPLSDVPFAVVSQVPVFPGCEGLATEKERKQCMSGKITEFVNKHFDTSLGKELGLEGMKRIYVQFRINKDGVVDNLRARAPHPKLAEEAKRVVRLLPEMEPGKQREKAVGVLYTLPITFMVGK